MSERKVLNKYFPPDFDPSKLDIKKIPSSSTAPVLERSGGGHVVRLMAPFSMRCLTCSEWIPKGKKFNARKEKAVGEHYLGIQIHRFYIRCPMCSCDITFKTDPEKTDYTCESGAQRNFEMVRDERLLEAEIQKEKEAEEARNPLSKLEARTLASKREMEILENLDELRTKSANYERGGSLEALQRIILSKHAKEFEEKQKQEKEDDELARSVFYNADGEIIKRVADKDPLELLRIKRIEVKNDLKRKVDTSVDLGVVRKVKKESTLSLLGSAYADSSSEADN